MTNLARVDALIFGCGQCIMRDMTSRNYVGLTLVEVLVLLVILLGVFLVMPTCSSPHSGMKGRGELSQALINMRQLYLATQQMALDATTEARTNIGWPGYRRDVH